MLDEEFRIRTLFPEDSTGSFFLIRRLPEAVGTVRDKGPCDWRGKSQRKNTRNNCGGTTSFDCSFVLGFHGVIVNTLEKNNTVFTVEVELKVTTKYAMDEIKYVPLTKFQIEPTLDDKFWFEKIKRSIQECDSVSTLKEMATLLAQIATQRQGVIRGLVQDMFIFNNIAVEDNLDNPQIPTQSE